MLGQKVMQAIAQSPYGIGLSHFWAKVKSALAGKQDALTPDGTIRLRDGAIGVALPAKAVSRAEYDAMTEAERQAETVYLVDGPAWEMVPMTIREYDTEDGWHVRKWSGGYVEMHHSSTIHPSFENFTLGPFYYSEIMPQDAPDVLLKYSDIFVIEEIIEGTGDYWLLKQKNGLSILGTNKSNLVLSIGRTITGRWK